MVTVAEKLRLWYTLLQKKRKYRAILNVNIGSKIAAAQLVYTLLLNYGKINYII